MPLRSLSLTGAPFLLVLLIAAVPGSSSGATSAAVSEPSEGAVVGRTVGTPADQCRLEGDGWEGSGLDTDTFQTADAVLEVSMLFVDFPDHPAAPAEAQPHETFGPDITDFAEEWVQENSYGRTTLDITYDDEWLEMSKPAADYGFDRIDFAMHRTFIQEAVDLAAAAGFDDRRTVFVSAAPTDGAMPQSPAFLGGRHSPVIAPDGTRIGWGATTGDDVRESDLGFGRKVLAHELGHTLGLPDLYLYAGGDRDALHAAAGAWDLMGDLSVGSHTLTWHKRKLGWLDPEQVGCVRPGHAGEFLITPSATVGGVKMVVVPVSDAVAYVAEVRSNVGLDAGLCDPDGGVLVYRVDAGIESGQGPVDVLPSETGSTATCGPLSFAPHDVGESYDTAAMSIDVLEKADGGYRVSVATDPAVNPCPAGTSADVVCTERETGGLVMAGTSGPDVFVGSAGPDLISGEGGNDTVSGNGGADVLVGGVGRDVLVGGAGKDRFDAGAGKDRIDATGQRRERVSCGGGRDRVVGARKDRVAADCERVSRRS